MSQKSAPEHLDDILREIKKNFSVEFSPLQLDDHSIDILSIQNMPEYLDKLIAKSAIQEPLRDLPLWAKPWPGAMILGRFLRRFEPQNKSLLELGCGMGILSLSAAQYGFRQILASDNNPMALNFAKANIIKNNLEDKIKTSLLDVTASHLPEDKKFDIIAASELLYLDALHRPLLKFISRHMAPEGKAIFCTDMARDKPAFAKLAARKFSMQEGKIAVKASDGEKRAYNILILGAKKNESF